MDQSIMHIDPDDIFLWPDDTWCFARDHGEYSHMSDDYQVLQVGSQLYVDFLESYA